MLDGKTNCCCSEIDTNHINARYGQNVGLFKVKSGERVKLRYRRALWAGWHKAAEAEGRNTAVGWVWGVSISGHHHHPWDFVLWPRYGVQYAEQRESNSSLLSREYFNLLCQSIRNTGTCRRVRIMPSGFTFTPQTSACGWATLPAICHQKQDKYSPNSLYSLCLVWCV